MTEKTEALLEVARRATPGPWRVSDFEVLSGGPDRVIMGADNYMLGYVTGRSEPEHSRDAEFIATFDPPQVIELLQRLLDVEAERDEARAALEACVEQLWHLAKDPKHNALIKQAQAALSPPAKVKP